MNDFSEMKVTLQAREYTVDELLSIIDNCLKASGKEHMALVAMKADERGTVTAVFNGCSPVFYVERVLSALDMILTPETMDIVTNAILEGIAEDLERKNQTAEERVMH